MGRAYSRLGLLPLLLLAGCVAGPAIAPTESLIADRTVYVTRHMQKLDGTDPGLSAEGIAAADRLAAVLADKGVTAIYATPTRRAMETAGALSRRTGVRITSYDPRDPQALVAAAATSKGSILIVGQSNTVHDIIARFGARNPPAPLTEQDYGTVFAITPNGEMAVILLTR